MKRLAGLFSRVGVDGAMTVALAGMVLLSVQSAPAYAEERPSFREFRQQNEGIDRSVARQMFHAQYGRGGSGGNGGVGIANPVQQVITVGPGSQTVSGSGIVNGARRNREFHVRNQSMQELSNGAMARVNKGIELDLGSTTKNIVLGRNLIGSNETVQITVGGKTETFSAGSQVTAAEYVAVKQVIAGGGQQVQLDRSGKASGGSVDLGSLTANNDVMRASSLVVPKDVTTYGDFGRRSDFRLSGDLSNFGTVQTLSSDANVRGGGIHADNITNNAGALINATGDLELNAARNLSNFGTIAASGNLELSAGGTVKNTGKVSSDGDLTVESATVSNRGTLASANGNVSFGTVSGDLLVDNRRGTVSAANAINVRDVAYTGSGNSLVVGGDLLSRELNVNSGLGTVNVNVDELTGTVNGTGSAAHVWADTANLNIGSVCLTGDPTFFNAAGSISIAGDILVSEELTIVAAGSITTADNVTIQAGDATRGYNITLISGAAFTTSGGNNQDIIGPISGSPPYSGQGSVTLSGKASKLGGSVVLGNNAIVNSRSTDISNPGNRNSGNIEIFAFGKDNGFVATQNGTLITSGVASGDNGNVTIVAEGGIKNNANPTVSLGDIIANGSGANGNVTVVTSAPTINGGKTVTYLANGSRSGSSFLSYSDKYTKTGGIQTSDSGRFIQAKGLAAFFSGGFSQPGDIEATSIIVYAGEGLFPSDGLLSASFAVNLSTGKKGFIGYPNAPVTVQAPTVQIITYGGNAAVQLNAATTNVIAEDSDQLIIQGNTLTGSLKASSYVSLAGGDINNLNIAAGDFIAVYTTSNITDNGTHFVAPSIALVADGADIGTSVAPMILNSKVEAVSLSADNAYVNVAPGGKSFEVAGGSVAGDLFVNAPASLGITGNVSGSDVRFINNSGEIVVHNGVGVSVSDNIQLQNLGTNKKDKITIGNSVALETIDGTISVMLGESSGTPAPTPANVSVSGNVQILGLGATAKAPVNTLDAGTSTITVSNTVNSKNLSLLGNVIMINQPSF
ncbi:hypothetical protein KF707_10845 [Candidatus Obscuribacterales bacterium]|nr:hypothetical protein [Candidatus Obscuribacterales bacterium]MBX3136723.1 hypothetical protein [Candidatus Obscuribacterales bacterium]MBX3148567.1 hypothetical protein [Candidatus Obscuribacterales bacterium]